MIGNNTKINVVQSAEARAGLRRENNPKIAPAIASNDELTSYRRANAELLEMIVTADLAHKGKKRTGRDENRKAIADDRERCRHAQHSEQ